MRKRVFVPLAAAFLITAPMPAEQQHQVTGIILRVERPQHRIVVSCDEIVGYMAAMQMSFTVANAKEMGSMHPGSPVRFTMVMHGNKPYAEHIQAVVAANLESEPMQAGALGTLQAALHPASTVQVVAQGQHVPDFELTDQAENQVRLSSFEGKVVLLTFGYSRCPNPDYCIRLSNNLARVRDRFAARSPRDLVLITIAIDPEYDTGEALRAYAAMWKADPSNWHFLTGPLPQIKSVAALFGMNFWRSEGYLTHSLHTVIIDRSGNLTANLEGNQFTDRQLGDLVQSVVDRPH